MHVLRGQIFLLCFDVCNEVQAQRLQDCICATSQYRTAIPRAHSRAQAAIHTSVDDVAHGATAGYDANIIAVSSPSQWRVITRGIPRE
ncbi:hypothetical protein BC628DRAFT_1027993 [Trametes gibbosa]|nr:hypothetical protein BC628DRAFT_1027993 [Trametes gibbosa]